MKITESEVTVDMKVKATDAAILFLQQRHGTTDSNPKNESDGLGSSDSAPVLRTASSQQAGRDMEPSNEKSATVDRREYWRRDLARRHAAPYVSGRDFHRYVIKAKTHDLMCRYIELPGILAATDGDGMRSIGPADVFVSWTWDTPWDILIETLQAHTDAAVSAGRPPPRYWLDIFAVNQHTALPPWRCESGLSFDKCTGCLAMGEDMMSLGEMEAGRVDKGFERVINSESCRETLLVLETWSAPRPVTRVWCLYEILLTVLASTNQAKAAYDARVADISAMKTKIMRSELKKLGLRVTGGAQDIKRALIEHAAVACQPDRRLKIGLPPAERTRLADVLRADISVVQRLVAAVDGETAEATMPTDREQIFRAVQRLLPRGFLDLNSEVRAQLRQWTYEAAASKLDSLLPADRGSSHLIEAIGLYYTEVGQYEKAEALFTEALAAREGNLGPEDRSTLKMMGNLGQLYVQMATSSNTFANRHTEKITDRLRGRQMSEYKRAEALIEKAATISRRVLGTDDVDTLNLIGALGSLYHSIGDDDAEEYMFGGIYEKSLLLLQETLAISERVLGKNHPDTVVALRNLASLLVSRGEGDLAEPLYVRGLEQCREILGEDHPTTAGLLLELAQVYAQQKVPWLVDEKEEYDKIVPLMEEALGLRRRLLGDDHEDTLAVIDALVDHMRDLIDNCDMVEDSDDNGDDDPHIVAGWNEQYVRSEIEEKFEPLLQEALIIRRRVNGPAHEETLTSMHQLAELYMTQERVSKALPVLEDELRSTLALSTDLDEEEYEDNLHEASGLANDLAVLLIEHGTDEQRSALKKLQKQHKLDPEVKGERQREIDRRNGIWTDESSDESSSDGDESGGIKGWFRRKLRGGRKARSVSSGSDSDSGSDLSEDSQKESDIGTMICDYTPSFDRAIPARAGDSIVVFDKSDANWWKVSVNEGQMGFVPASMIKLQTKTDSHTSGRTSWIHTHRGSPVDIDGCSTLLRLTEEDVREIQEEATQDARELRALGVLSCSEEQEPQPEPELTARAQRAAEIRPSLLLGITLQGAKEFAAEHWNDVCDPQPVRDMPWPSDEDGRREMARVLRDAGHTNTWPGDCPVLRVLSGKGEPETKPTAGWRKQAAGQSHKTNFRKNTRAEAVQDIGEVVRTQMNGYNNQAAIVRACPEGHSWCEELQRRGSPHVGRATVFVSWALGQRMSDLLDAMERWLSDSANREEDHLPHSWGRGRDPANTFFWICDFCIRQTGPETKADVAKLPEIVSATQHTLLFLDPWRAPEPLRRAWCIWELYHTVDSGAELQLIMSNEQAELLADAFMGEEGEDPGFWDELTSAISILDAATRKEADRKMILDTVESGVGSQQLNALVREALDEKFEEIVCHLCG
jgi:tetratricopeptide (TPR) repeat protein